MHLRALKFSREAAPRLSQKASRSIVLDNQYTPSLFSCFLPLCNLMELILEGILIVHDSVANYNSRESVLAIARVGTHSYSYCQKLKFGQLREVSQTNYKQKGNTQ